MLILQIAIGVALAPFLFVIISAAIEPTLCLIDAIHDFVARRWRVIFWTLVILTAAGMA